MKPLSAFNYIKENKRAVIAIILAIAAGVFLIYTVNSIFNSNLEIERRVCLEPLKYFSRVTFAEKSKAEVEQLITKIKEQEDVVKVIPVRIVSDGVKNYLGDIKEYPIYFLGREDMKFLLNRMEIKIKKGRLPYYMAGEIAFDSRAASSWGIKWDDIGIRGGSIGPFQARFVGLLEGESCIAVSLLTNKVKKYNNIFTEGLLVVPRNNRREKVNVFLTNLTNKKMKVDTYQKLKKELAKSDRELKLMVNIISLLIIIVLVITIGNTGYVYCYRRRREFGALYALGYSRFEIMKKVFIEIIIINLIGLITGILLSWLLIWGLNSFASFTRGFPIRFLDLRSFFRVMPIPLFLTGVSLLFINNLIKELEVVDIIEGKG